MGRKIAFVNTIIILLMIASVSCKVEKRIYRKGYHVVWNHSRIRTENRTEPTKIDRKNLDQEVQEVLVTNNNSGEENLNLKHTPLLVLDNDTCGDVLLLQNADELKVKILEIDEKNIKYKRCDNISGPIYTIAKNKVALIKYANGIKEVIQQDTPLVNEKPKTLNKPQEAPKTNMLGLISFIGHIGVSVLSRGFRASVTTGLGLAGFIGIVFLAALILAYVALFQFRNEPGKYTGKWMPLVVIGLDMAGILILALLLVAFGSVFSVGVGSIAIVLLVIFALMLGLLIFALSPKPQEPQYTNEK